MRRAILAGVAASAASLAFVAAASAAIVELGGTKTAIAAPTCPSGTPPAQCTIILTRATALETIRDGIAYPTTVKAAGQVVAFTVGLSQLSTSATTRTTYVRNLDKTYGGVGEVAITVLRPTGAKNLREWKVVAQSPLFHIESYLGQVVEFPLKTTLSVRRGDVIALTTPTWAPVLTIQQASKQFAYRQSRKGNCSKPPGTSQAQVRIGQSAQYACNYPGTRIEYLATEVTSPVAPKGTTPTSSKPKKKKKSTTPAS